MAPRRRWPRLSPISRSRAAKAVIEAAEFYHEFVPKEDQAATHAMESEAKLAREFKEDEEVEHQVGGIIPDLGCTRTRNSKFYRTLELYWYTNDGP